MGPHKNKNNQNTKGLPQVKAIPKHIYKRPFQLPFKKCTDGEVDGVPDANEEVGPSPNPRDVVDPLHVSLIQLD